MASYKRLKGLAHNVAHSYFSVMNRVDGKFVVDDIVRNARLAGVADLQFDLLAGTIAPPDVATPRIAKSLVKLRRHLPLWATWENCDFEAITSFVLELHLRFHEPPDPEDPDTERWDLDARGVIVDDRGRMHEGQVQYRETA